MTYNANCNQDLYFCKKNKRETGIEPATFSLARRRSTTEPLAHIALITTQYVLYIIDVFLSICFNKFFTQIKMPRTITVRGQNLYFT